MRKPGGACGPGPPSTICWAGCGAAHAAWLPCTQSGQSAPPRSTSGPHALRPAACGVHPFAGHPWDPCWCTCCGASLLAPSGEERTLDTFAQVERAGRCCRRFDSGTHAWCGHATVMVLVSSASGPRVSGCTFYPRSAVKYFNPISVKPYAVPCSWVRVSCVTVFLVSRCAGG